MTNATHPGWPLWKLALLLYPFAASAVAINLFMLALIGPEIGLGILPPVTALVLSVPLGIPATLAAAVWVRHLLREAGK